MRACAHSSSPRFPPAALASIQPMRRVTRRIRTLNPLRARPAAPPTLAFACLLVRRPSYRSAAHEALRRLILLIARFEHSPPVLSCTAALTRLSDGSFFSPLVQMTPLCAAHCRPPVLPPAARSTQRVPAVSTAPVCTRSLRLTTEEKKSCWEVLIF